VGTDIAPGTYRTRADGPCFWERLSDFGSPSYAIAYEFTIVPAVVTISPTDAGFFTDGGCVWTTDLSPITASPTNPFGGGTYFVGAGNDIAPGTWTDTGGTDCVWMRLSGFNGAGTDVIASGGATGLPEDVTIDPADAGFKATPQCGTWTKTG
jgi:hypothetical protein